MSNQTASQETQYKLSELIDYYEVCNKAEGRNPKIIVRDSAKLRRFSGYLKSRHLPDSIDNIDIKSPRKQVISLLKKTGMIITRIPQRRWSRYRTKPTLPRINNAFLSIHGYPLTENSTKLVFARLAQRSDPTVNG
jgi:hypothetical protein